MADALKGMMNKITSDDPEVRGQQLWVMFALSLFLVAGMNWYAYIREPDIVEVDELVEYKNEVVKVKGTLISWVEDPYGSGDDRIDAIIEDETGVVEARWFRPGQMPPIGTTVTVMGDVIEYEGRMWIQSLGAGAFEWSASDLPTVTKLAIADVAKEPWLYANTTVELTGFIGETITPDATFTSAYLGDHPNYGNSDHQMHIIVRSATHEWIEASSKIQVRGTLQYQQRDIRWSLLVQGSEIIVDSSHNILITQLDWVDEATWSYQSGQLVDMSGLLDTNGEVWTLVGPNNARICVIPLPSDTSSLEAQHNTLVTFRGRLTWSTSSSQWCIDATNGEAQDMVIPQSAPSILGLLSADPLSLLGDENQRYTVSAFVKYAIEPSVDDERGFVVDAAAYTPGWTTVAATFPGPRTTWIEAGQSIVANISILWDDQDMRIRFIIHEYTLGSSPLPRTLLWDDGAIQWGYTLNQRVYLDGKAFEEDGQWYLTRDGSDLKIQLSAMSNGIGMDDVHRNQSMTWEGRLVEYEVDEVSMGFRLVDADPLDSDGDGLADTVEEAFGTSPFSEDSDDDGIDDRTEYEQQV
jgi:hypothetical protein